MNSRAIVEVGRSVRPYLSELAGEDAHALDSEIYSALSSGLKEEDIAARLLTIFNKNVTVLQWSEDVLEDPLLLPPELQGERAPYEGYVGLGMLISPERYACPDDGSYVWYRSGVEDIPQCPGHEHRVVRQPMQRDT